MYTVCFGLGLTSFGVIRRKQNLNKIKEVDDVLSRLPPSSSKSGFIDTGNLSNIFAVNLIALPWILLGSLFDNSEERQLRKKRGGYTTRYHIDRWLVRFGLLFTGLGMYKLYF